MAAGDFRLTTFTLLSFSPFFSGASGRTRRLPLVHNVMEAAAAAKGMCHEKRKYFPSLPPANTHSLWKRHPICGCFQTARHLQTTTPACKGSHTPSITNAFIHRNYSHSCTCTQPRSFIFQPQLQPHTRLQRLGHVHTAGTCLQKVAFLLLLCPWHCFFPPGGFSSEVYKILAGINFCHSDSQIPSLYKNPLTLSMIRSGTRCPSAGRATVA